MFKNHIKIAWRNLKINRMFSLLNILGLSIGLAITILLFLYVSYEYGFDSMYSQKENIHRILVHSDGDNGKETWVSAPAALAPVLMTDVPEIKYAARMLKNDFGGTASVKVGNRNFIEKNLFWVDNELLKIFQPNFLKGKPETALVRPNTVAISQSISKKYFGNQEALGKTIKVDNRHELEITGVYEDFPKNSTIDCDVMASFSTSYFYKKPSWNNVSFETYCLLKSNSKKESAESRLQPILDKNVEKLDQWYTLSFQPFQQVHLYSADFSESYSSRVGDINEVKNFSLLAVLILLIASVNYMNLTTARSQKRSKEVGISKTLGASVSSLIRRFYVETGLLTALAMFIGVLLALFVIPLFNQLSGMQLDFGQLLNYEFAITLLTIWLVTTLISGSYPAVHLSRFSPIMALSSVQGKGKGSSYVRKGLVVFQFAASIILMIGMLVFYQQIEFMRNKKLGFNPENVVAISATGIRGNQNKNALIQEFKGLGEVSAVAMAQGYPGLGVSGRTLRKKSGDLDGLNIQTNVTDNGIIDVLQLDLLAGHTLPKVRHEGDTIVDVILNKKAITYLGYSPQEAIGKEVHISVTNRIVGVVDDFNHESLHMPIGAYAFHNNTGEPKSYLLVRFSSSELSNSITRFEEVFKNVAPDSAFDFNFLDKHIEQLYEREKKAASIGLFFCVLAIFVACLGLFGLAAFMAEQRKKEIGVRKVLGASILNITQMLSKDFVQLILIALVIAFPIALWLMENWLEKFAYRISISWLVFVVAGTLAIFIALVTVSFQAIRAALANPVKSLRSE